MELSRTLDMGESFSLDSWADDLTLSVSAGVYSCEVFKALSTSLIWKRCFSSFVGAGLSFRKFCMFWNEITTKVKLSSDFSMAACLMTESAMAPLT